MINHTFKILKQVAERHGVSVEAMKSKCRKDRLVRARMEFVIRVKKERPHLTDSQIGRFVNRSSWTVYYYRDYEWRERRIALSRLRARARRGREKYPDNGRHWELWKSLHQETAI